MRLALAGAGALEQGHLPGLIQSPPCMQVRAPITDQGRHAPEYCQNEAHTHALGLTGKPDPEP